MFGSNMIEIGIGLSLVFLFVSLICTAAREVIESWMKTRAMDLERGIREMLSDPDGSTITKALFDHPQIFALFPGHYNPESLRPVDGEAEGTRNMPRSERKNLPSYIPAANFANALIDVVARGAVHAAPGAAIAAQPLTIEGLRASVATLPNERLQRAVLSAIDLAQGDLDKVKDNLENWFNSSMDRVTGWYKRRTQKVLALIGVVAAVAFNVDAVHIAKQLSSDKTLREAVVKQADKIVGPTSNTGSVNDQKDRLAQLQKKSFDQLREQMQEIGFPVGWPAPQLQTCKKVPDKSAANAETATCTKQNWGDLDNIDRISLGLQVVPGWAITALAIMLGAPFWFDILSKFMMLRSSLKPPQKKEDDEDDDKNAGSLAAPKKPPAKRPARGAAAAVAPAAPAVPAAAGIAFEPNTWSDGSNTGVL